MKTAIIYATKHGATERVALLLQKSIGDGAVLFNLKRNSLPDLSKYATVIIGGSIHAGGIQKNVKRFYQKTMSQLHEKRLALYLCCMDEGDRATEHFNNSFPADLREHSICNILAGGEFDFSKMNFFERKIVQKVSGIYESVSKLNYEQINKLIETLAKSASNTADL